MRFFLVIMMSDIIFLAIMMSDIIIKPYCIVFVFYSLASIACVYAPDTHTPGESSVLCVERKSSRNHSGYCAMMIGDFKPL